MFTGLVEAVGRLRARIPSGEAGKLSVETALATQLKPGDSVAVNGVCLTVETVDPATRRLGFHTLQQTLAVTNLGRVAIDGLVNLERPLSLGDRLGGHLVLGHVDGTAACLDVRRQQDDWVFTFALPEALRPLAIDKGSIAVDGISLTIAHLATDRFSVHIIPFTWDHTDLQEVTAGTIVNLEMDMIGKYVLRSASLGLAAKADVPF